MACYTPEMGEEAPERLFHSEYNAGKTYSLCWRVADDLKARAVLSKLMIRPKLIELRTQAEGSSEAKRLQSDVYGCLITLVGHRKLRDLDQTAIMQYLN
jgi:hypothetical protein